MTIKPRQNLVIIKGVDHTDNILRITHESKHTVVTFKKGKTYRYTSTNVECFSSPEHIPVDNYRFIVAGDVLSDVAEVLRFGNWVKIFHGSGGSRCCRFSEFSAKPMESSNGRSMDMLAYFRELAEGVTLRTDDGDSLLAMKYRQLNTVSHHSILSRFLQARYPGPEPGTSDSTSLIIFPFGCNMTQKTAVQRALQHPVSLIQGPPGTGKTQTILNLIGNMLLQKKRVAVVSNNNSATANVLEKLQKYELDFVVAFLGSAQNKQAFIEGQTGTTVRMPTLDGAGQENSVREEILRLNQELDKKFETKNELAAVIQQIDALRLELTHFERFQQQKQDRDSDTRVRTFRPKVSALKLMNSWLACEREAKRYADTNASSFSNPPLSSNASFASLPTRAASRHVGLLEKIRLLLRFGMAGRVFFQLSDAERISLLQEAYYQRKLAELESRQKTLEDSLEKFSFDKQLKRLTTLSMQLMQHCLAERYNNRARTVFTPEDLWRQPEKFLDEYPIVLSTTFSVITSVQNGYLFDCVIVDEASQVDLLNGVLAMACAEKLVVVGDPMQLPNVLTEQDKKRAKLVAERYEVPRHARFERHNLLSAVRAAFRNIPETLLREHYRCHPKIIQFCNQKFYEGELLVMTRDQDESDVLKAYMTVEGRHARGTINQRQIDEILENVLPELGSVEPGDIGIVSPYKAQTARMQASVSSKEIEVDTVHKYQGREKRVMIITTVSNEANEFVDNPNLLNVAISRAQEKLRLVVSKEMAEGNGNVADFVRYIRYSNCEVIPGKVRSVFDLLYSEYTTARLEILKKRKRVSKYDSENLTYREIEAVLQEKAFRGYSVVLQFPLSMLVQDTMGLTTEESAYATHPWTKTDFLLYRKVDKNPVLVIEVDGYAFHREGTRQSERDALKDSVLKKCGLPVLRLSTIGSNERSRIRKKLEEVTKVRQDWNNTFQEER
ncbi:AAA domain-containing protein [Desulfobulbus alkaliphilus]|uniref:AAA domain-containing protein n=1 Tax=Desulfobulbus alkaliphilus TaxID=869814 RepID=UPI0019657714|nr:AAA domain-containing protein [Desulfobulbus alkaliphilus]MBM9535663.1 AAA family ATPase [Desulfobulbus alkaliphilus]